MSKNEHTSEQIASFASEIERMDQPVFMTADLWKKIKAVAGSALTQAPDKKESGLVTGYKRAVLKSYFPKKENTLKFDAAKAFKEMIEKK